MVTLGKKNGPIGKGFKKIGKAVSILRIALPEQIFPRLLLEFQPFITNVTNV
jgi:hypothetical protein